MTAARRFPQTSDELTDALLVRGKATPRREEPVRPTPLDTAPSLYERTFTLTDIAVLRGDSARVGPERSLTFTGHTTRPPAQRVDDTRTPTLDLDGQAFFDRAFSQSPAEAVLLVGGPELAAPMGVMRRTATVVDGPLAGSAVRAFVAEGPDRALPESLPLLAGFQGEPTLASARAATQASHPLVALDALRQAARLGASDQVEVLARSLLDPSQPTSVEAAAIELVAEAIREVAFHGRPTDTLVELLEKVKQKR